MILTLQEDEKQVPHQGVEKTFQLVFLKVVTVLIICVVHVCCYTTFLYFCTVHIIIVRVFTSRKKDGQDMYPE